MAAKHRDPATPDWQIGFWSAIERERMDAQFIDAMQRAGHECTAPSTRPGTRCPVANHQRD
jgi:hypothetical protein